MGISATEDLLEAQSVVVSAPLWDVVGAIGTESMGPTLLLPARFCLPGKATGGSTVQLDPRMESVAQVTEDELIRRIRAAAGVPDVPARS
jgi:hypothetical protein